MSFESITFAYTPPPTVPNQPSETDATAAVGPAEARQSVAASLATQLEDLVDTSAYLQSVIRSLHPGLGITVDASNPDLGMALSSIYNGKVPTAISLTMYSNTLDAELGSMQVNIAAGPDAAVEANTLQHQALMTINKSFEAQMLADGSFAAQSALLLRSLKSNAILHAGIQGQLLQYPATSKSVTTGSLDVIIASDIDISAPIAAHVQDGIDAMGRAYSSMFTVLAKADAVAADVANVVITLATVAAVDLIRIKAMIDMVKRMLPMLSKDLFTGMSSFVLQQAALQASGLMFQLDRIEQMAITPVLAANNAVTSIMQRISGAMQSVGSLVGVIRSMKQPSPVSLSGPLTGMPLNNASVSGLPVSHPAPPKMANLGFSKGLNELGSLMHFCVSKTDELHDLQRDSFQRLSARVSQDAGKAAELLSVCASLGSLVSLVGAFIKDQQNVAAVATSAPAQLETVGRILASSQTGSGSSYTVRGGIVSVTPPAIPPPTPKAASVFARSGIQSTLTGLTQKIGG